ncbi:hypothetical protein DRP04_11465 [Archaeoglobales archaeon]|nr:MAG: hypothetical protein DRP04_11465 [Archaeoglobales archaeon]
MEALKEILVTTLKEMSPLFVHMALAPLHELVHVVAALARGEKIVKIDWFGKVITIPKKLPTYIEYVGEEFIAELVRATVAYLLTRKFGNKYLLALLSVFPVLNFVESSVRYLLKEHLIVKRTVK